MFVVIVIRGINLIVLKHVSIFLADNINSSLGVFFSVKKTNCLCLKKKIKTKNKNKKRPPPPKKEKNNKTKNSPPHPNTKKTS